MDGWMDGWRCEGCKDGDGWGYGMDWMMRKRSWRKENGMKARMRLSREREYEKIKERECKKRKRLRKEKESKKRKRVRKERESEEKGVEEEGEKN